MKVVVATPVFSLNGVNVFSANLVRGLRALGHDARLLLTRPEQPDPKPLPLPEDVPVDRLPVAHRAPWPTRWRAMTAYLEERAPCVYLPGYDLDHSGICPVLSDRVAVVGIVHSDDPQHYEHVRRLGRTWNAVVAVSREIADRTLALDASLAPRLATIPYGVPVPGRLPERPAGGRPLRVVYAGRLVEEQKRVLDLPRIAHAALARGVSVELTIVGAGVDRPRLERAFADLSAPSTVRFLGTLPNRDVLSELGQSDVFLLTSSFEGLPLGLLEAMAHGCVPVVSRVASGVTECVRDGENGFLVPVGDADAFAGRLLALHSDPALRRRLAVAASETIARGGFDVETMARRYADLLALGLEAARNGAFVRPRGPVLPPPSLRPVARLLHDARGAGLLVARRLSGRA